MRAFSLLQLACDDVRSALTESKSIVKATASTKQYTAACRCNSLDWKLCPGQFFMIVKCWSSYTYNLIKAFSVVTHAENQT